MGAGKDTVGEYLVKEHGFTRLAFADKLKESVAALFNLRRQEVDDFKDNGDFLLDRVNVLIDIGNKVQVEFSWREFLQRYGTEAHRDIFGSNFWVDAILPHNFHHSEHKFVVTDARFENELSRIKALRGYNIRIVRPSQTVNSDHASEQLPDESLVDYMIQNTGTMESLLYKVEDMLEYVTQEDLRGFRYLR